MVLRPALPPDRRWLGAKALAHALALSPLLLLGHDAWIGTLGPDPVAELSHRTGLWALRLLLLCLAVTPLRRLSGRVWPLRFRRLLGLYAFAYASVHLLVYLVLDMNGFWDQALADLVKRPYLVLGALAWLLLLPLAATSTRGAMRRLGRHWGQLHRLVYAAAALAAWHFLWQVKADLRQPLAYALILAVLLAFRLEKAWRHRRLKLPSAASRPARP